MTPPPRPPDDADPPPPATPVPRWGVVDPGRDPLLDDPLFAELVRPSPADATLPVAEVVQPPAAPAPIPARPTARPVGPPRSDPGAPPRVRPVRPPTVTGGRRDPAPRPPAPAPPDDPGRRADGSLPSPRPLAACGVIGCLGVAVLVAVGVLTYGLIFILGQLGEGRGGDRGGPPPPVAATAARPGPVGPTRLAEARVNLALPGEVDAVGRAGGGRFLLLRIPGLNRIEVFDANSGGLAAPIALDEPGSLFAGGASKVFVYKPKAQMLERYDLLTATKEGAGGRLGSLSGTGGLAVGAGTDGPVFLADVSAGQTQIRVFDERLAPLDTYPIPDWTAPADGRVHLRASDDGRTLGAAAKGGAVCLRFDPEKGFTVQELQALAGLTGDVLPPPLATPSPDGAVVHTSRGPFATGGWPQVRGKSGYFFTFPAAHGGLFASLSVDDGAVSGPLRLHAAGSGTALATIPGDVVAVPPGLKAADAPGVPADQRVHVWPAAGLVAVFKSHKNDVLELTKVDVGAALEKGKKSYLVFGSDPPTTAARGAEWRYKPVVWAGGGRAARLGIVEPPEARLSPAGDEVVWTPAGKAGEVVTVTVRAAAGFSTAEQKVRVTVVDE